MRSILFFLPGFASLCLSAQRSKIVPQKDPSLRFTENAGQWDDKILFRAQLDGGNLYFEKNCLTFNFYDKKKFRSLHHGGILKGQYSDATIKCHAFKMHFVNGLEPRSVEKTEAGPDYENFVMGNDPAQWKGGVRNYHRIVYRNLYEEVDYEVLSAVQGIKYNFHVKPGADASKIQIRYEGLNDMGLVNEALVYRLNVGSAIEHKPLAWQLLNGKVKIVACKYNLKENILSFDFPEGYDPHFELVIDPTLIFAAQSGSTADNFGMCATWDASGNFYSGGTAFDIGYPATPGAYDLTFSGPPAQGMTDVVISKYSSNGAALLYATYFGGSDAEIVTSLIVDHSGNLCLYGATSSTNFPTSPGCYDNSYNGGQMLSFVFNGTTFNNGTDIYLAKFNSAGSSLLASTYFGGSNNDGVNHVNAQNPLPPPNPPLMEYLCDSLQCNYGDQYRGEIQIDRQDNIYIASSTRSSNFPTTGNACDNSLGGTQDAVLAKFNSSLSQLLYSTYLGGSSNDCGNALVVTNSQEVYITGGTCSSGFPTTPGAYMTVYGGGKADGYVSRINTVSGSLIQSSFMASIGNNYDQCYFVQQDAADNVYVYGQSLGNMPVIPSGTLPVYSNAGTHQFVTRLNPNLSNITLSTVFGSNTSSLDISPSAFSVDKCNNIYVSGWGGNIVPPMGTLASMPLMAATQSTTDGNDFYLMGLSANATNLIYGSYFGGAISDEHVDGGTSRIDKNGIFYQSVCAGCGGNDDFPVTPGAWPNIPGNPNQSNNCNNGVFKIDMNVSLAASNILVNNISGCAPFTSTFTNGSPGSSFIWYLGNGQTNTVNLNPVVTYTNQGTYTVSLVVTTPTSCNYKDSSSVVINVGGSVPNLTVFASPNTICSGQTATLFAMGATTYSWSNGATGSTIMVSPLTTTIYTVTGLSGSCAASSTIQVFSVTLPVAIAASTSTVCSGSSVTLTASGALTYSWNTGATGTMVVATPTSNFVYNVVGYGGGCYGSAQQSITVVSCPGFKEQEILQKFSVYPNPSSGQFIIEGNNERADLFFEVQDVSGRIVLKGNFDSEKKMIDLGKFPKAVYLLKISDHKQLISVKTLAVE